MTAATNSTLGTICLAGDLAGTASSPELAATGVKAKAYNSVSKIHVDSKGRIQWCGGANFANDIAPSMPVTSDTTAGIFRIGPNINVSSGTISVNTASASQFGLFKLGNNLEINQSTGAVDIVLPDASASSLGLVQLGTGFTTYNGALTHESFLYASTTNKGMVKIGSGFNVDSGALETSTASDTVAGTAIIDNSNFYLDTSTQTLYPHAANYMLYGLVYGWSSDFALDENGKLTFTSPYANTVATASTLGKVKIGSGINISSDGTISIYPVEATTSAKGLIEVADGFDVTGGVLSVNLASDSGYGVAKINPTYFTSTSGVLTANAATTSTKGVVQVGSGFSVAGGILSVADATGTNMGVVQVGSNIDVSSGTISVPLATAGVKGLMTAGSNMSISGNTISIPDATTTNQGVITTGVGFHVSSGVLTALNPTEYTTGIASYGA